MAVMMTAIVSDFQFAFEQDTAAPVRQHAVPDGGPQLVACLAQLGFELGSISRVDHFELISLR